MTLGYIQEQRREGRAWRPLHAGHKDAQLVSRIAERMLAALDAAVATGRQPEHNDRWRKAKNGQQQGSSKNSTQAGKADPDSESGSFKATPQQEALVNFVQRTHDYYELFSVSKVASEDEIKKSYRKLALQLHPDKNAAQDAEEAFKKVVKVWQVLGNKNKRKQYDKFGAEKTFEEEKTDAEASTAPSSKPVVHACGGRVKHLASVRWKFLVFQDDTPNAMVLPDGSVVIHTGLLRLFGCNRLWVGLASKENRKHPLT